MTGERGWRTTEFWLTVLTNGVAIACAAAKCIEWVIAVIVIAVANCLYGILRMGIKKAIANRP